MGLKKPADPAKLEAYYEKLNAKRQRKRDRLRPVKEEAKRLALLPIERTDFSTDWILSDDDPSKECEGYLPWGRVPPEVTYLKDYTVK